MSTIYPEKISIIAFKVIKANLQTSETYIAKPQKVLGFDLEMGQNTAFNFEQLNVRIRLFVKIEGVNEENEHVGVSGDFGFEFHIHVENLEEFIIVQDEKQMVNSLLGGTLFGIVFSTARGIIMEKTASSALGTVILPVIDPKTLLEK